MKKVPCRLPDSELDIMLVLWHNKPPMSRLEIERIVNEKKTLAPTTVSYTHLTLPTTERV